MMFAKARSLLTAARQLLLLLAALSLSATGVCAPLPLQTGGKIPRLTDDASRSSLKTAVGRSIAYLRKLPADRQFNYCGNSYAAGRVIASLETFVSILDRAASAEELQKEIEEKFIVCRAGKPASLGPAEKMLVTGYYEPLLEGSLEKKPPYIYPLYKMPPDLVSRPEDKQGNSRTGRLENGRLLPYWTRAEIENNDLLAGSELVYLADPVDVFILQVQGSGRVRLRDGSLRGIQYAAANGRPYRSIGKLLVDEGVMTLAEVTLPRIRQYLAAHPEERKRILQHNESFIFFRWGDTAAPRGSLGEELTAGRSVAADHSSLPAAGLGFLQTQRPVLDDKGAVSGWTPMSRFVLIQDSGSAVKGPGRLDFFWGSGDYAAIAAGRMKHPGEFHLLIKKDD